MRLRFPPYDKNYEGMGDALSQSLIKRHFVGRTLEHYAMTSGHRPRPKGRESESLFSTKYRVHSQYVNQILLTFPSLFP